MVRFDCSAAVAAVTPKVFVLSNSTDNPTYYNTFTNPVVAHLLRAVAVSASGVCKVEFGVSVADGSGFVPLFPVRLIAGIPFRHELFGSPSANLAHATVNQWAVRVTVPTDATVAVSGELQSTRS